MIIRGPAVVKVGTQVLYTEGDITLTPTRNTFDMPTSMFGVVDQREDNFRYEVGFTPVGMATAAYFNTLYPVAYRNPVLGATIFGSSDVDLVIWTVDGKQITLKRAALTKMPDLNFAANKPLFGECTYTALGTKDEAWTATGHFAAVSELAFSDTSFDPASLKTLVYAAAFGDDDPWDDINTEEGFGITFNLGLSEVPSDKYGIADITLSGLTASAKCIPHGITEQQMIDAMGIQGAGAGRGQSIFRSGKDLSLTAGSGNPYFTLKNAAIKTVPQQFGAEVNRTGEVEFAAVQSVFTAGVRQPIFDIGVTA
jgi:hypothetical protein